MSTSNGKWRALLQVILFSGFASLAGCGKDGNGNGNSSGFSNPGSVLIIQNYSIDGNRPLLTGSVVPQIDSAVIPPSFGVNWTITGNNVYTAHVFFSIDNILDSSDIEILVGCGRSSSSLPCVTAPVVYSCSFSSSRSIPSVSPTIACNDPVTSVDASYPLPTNWVLGSPAYLILQACNQASGACPSSSIPLAREVRLY